MDLGRDWLVSLKLLIFSQSFLCVLSNFWIVFLFISLHLYVFEPLWFSLPFIVLKEIIWVGLEKGYLIQLLIGLIPMVVAIHIKLYKLRSF